MEFIGSACALPSGVKRWGAGYSPERDEPLMPVTHAAGYESVAPELAATSNLTELAHAATHIPSRETRPLAIYIGNALIAAAGGHWERYGDSIEVAIPNIGNVAVDVLAEDAVEGRGLMLKRLAREIGPRPSV